MLENPKAPGATICNNPWDVTMDNQQATGIVAGLYLGEGHFSIASCNPKKIHVEVGFSNQDPALIDFVCQWLDTHQIPFGVYSVTNCTQVRVFRLHAIQHLLDLLIPLLFGQKLYQARLVLRYVERRLVKSGGNAARSYDETDHALVAEMRQLRESSETIRVPQLVN